MADPELDAIRKQRLADMQSQFKGGENAGDMAKAQEQARQQEESKQMILSQVLDQSARARLNTLMLCKPEKGQIIENMLLRMAQTGQIRGKIGEDQFIEMLNSVNAQLPQHKTTVKFDRRRAALDSDDEDF